MLNALLAECSLALRALFGFNYNTLTYFADEVIIKRFRSLAYIVFRINKSTSVF